MPKTYLYLRLSQPHVLALCIIKECWFNYDIRSKFLRRIQKPPRLASGKD